MVVPKPLSHSIGTLRGYQVFANQHPISCARRGNSSCRGGLGCDEPPLPNPGTAIQSTEADRSGRRYFGEPGDFLSQLADSVSLPASFSKTSDWQS